MVRPAQKIPVMKPLLPTVDKIVPYMQEVDKNRWYANFGPLVMKFEERMAELFGIEPAEIISTSSGTASIVACMRAMNLPQGGLCICPSWTFAATPAAAMTVGLVPHFVDVDEKSWVIEPEAVKEQLKYIPGKVACVMPVSAFGYPIDTEKWQKFQDETGIPVIIDAAAAFDSVLQANVMKINKVPLALSMHASKTFGIGEGGLLISKDRNLIHRSRQMSNFGFKTSREIELPGINSKMSEYSAAVGHAALDEWPQKRAKLLELAGWYLEEFGKHPQARIEVRLHKGLANSTCNVRLPAGRANEVIEQLNAENIEARKWWYKGCHQQVAFKDCPRFALPVTEKLAESTIAIPFSLGMKKDEVQYIVNQLVSLF